MNEYINYKAIEYKVDEKNYPELYKMVEEQAKAIGLDLKKEGIGVSILAHVYDVDLDHLHLKGFKDTASIDYFSKTLHIGINLPARIADRLKNPDDLDAALAGIIRHELQHYKDFRNGFYDDLMDPGMANPLIRFIMSKEISNIKKLVNAGLISLMLEIKRSLNIVRTMIRLLQAILIRQVWTGRNL